MKKNGDIFYSEKLNMGEPYHVMMSSIKLTSLCFAPELTISFSFSMLTKILDEKGFYDRPYSSFDAPI